MKTMCKRSLLLSAGMGAAAMLWPGALFGEAAPGPITPPADSIPATAAAPAPRPRVAQGKPTIIGSWRFNKDDSDDPRRKLQDAQASDGGSGGHGRMGGGYPGGGYPGGGYPGGGYPGGGGGGGYGGHRGQSGYSNDDLNRLSDVMTLPRTVSVVKSDAVVELTDDLDRKREFFTDGRKLDKSKNSKDDSYREVSAKWDEARLVTQEDGPKGGKIERILTPVEGENGMQLNETFKIMDSHGNTTTVIRLVFDRVEQPADSGRP